MTQGDFPKLVRDLMTVGVQTCTVDTPISEIAFLILEKNIEEVVVMEDGNAIGIVGQDELVNVLDNPEWRSLVARNIMREDILYLPPDIPLGPAVQIMRDNNVRAVFLMHHAGGIKYPAGVLSYRHLLRLLAAKEPKDLADLGIRANRQLPLDSFRERKNKKRLPQTNQTINQEF